MYFVCKLAPLDTSIQQLWVFGLLFCTWSAFFFYCYIIYHQRAEINSTRSVLFQTRKENSGRTSSLNGHKNYLSGKNFDPNEETNSSVPS
jgi:hypothetical protein